jgi:tetratricopeptide (TPR) repeat protein
LIIDNADDSTLELPKLFPSGIRGTILITSCNANSKQYGSAGSYRVDEMPTEDSINLLLKTAAISNTQDEKMRKAAQDVATVLGNLALAIVQAGAVIRQRFCSLEDYCTVYSHQKKELLESGKPTPDENYKYSVYTTWEISINKIEQMCNKKSSFALDLLAILSFMHFDGIKEDFFRRACQNYIYRGGIFSQTCLHENMPSGWDQLSIGQALSILASSSLISMDETRRFTIDPLVHEWSRDRMCPKDRVQAWKLTASILAMSIKYEWAPDDEQHRRALLPHIDACLRFAESEKALFVEGPDLVEQLIIADKFALAYHQGGRWSDSFTLYIEILKKREMILGPNHQDTLMSMRNVVVCLKRLCHYKEAIELGEQLVEKALQNPLPNPAENERRVLKFKLDIAEVWGNFGDYKAAQALYEQVIIDCTKGSFEDDFLSSDAKIGLASCYYHTDKFGEAVKLQEEVLQTYQRIFPAEHLSRILVLAHLNLSYDALKRTKKSRLLRQQTVDSMNLTLPKNHPYILTEMALLASHFSWPGSKRKLEAAKGVLQKMKETLGEHHALTLHSASVVAGCYFTCGCLQRARILQEYVITGQEKIWPENHPHLLESRKFLSSIKRAITIRKVFYCWVPFNVDRFEP